ncbi:hypothetical protein F4814DRAFT_153968 [Daldinia grandis]|nr:hypothetical protein F4814DRAFT_153968 [Daldinia grandis]
MATSSKVIYRNAEDWETLKDEITRKARSLNIWEHINPTEPTEWPTPPSRPSRATYEEASRRGGANGRGGPRRGASALADSPNTLEEAQFDSVGYNAALAEYQIDRKEYEVFQKANATMVDWMCEVVTPSAKLTLLPPDENLKQWYQHLAEAGSAVESSNMSRARDEYLAARGAIIKNPKKIAEWIQRWQEAMAKGRNHGVPDTLTAEIWAQELISAMTPILPNWASNFRMIHKEAIKNNQVTYQKVAADILEEASILNKGTGKLWKAGFLALHGEEEAEEEQDSSDQPQQDPPHNRRGRGRGRRSPRGAPRNTPRGNPRGGAAGKKRSHHEANPSTDNGNLCRFCLTYHPNPYCYYAFREKAPEGWRGNKAIEAQIQHRLENEDALREEYNRLKKKMDTGSFPDAS